MLMTRFLKERRTVREFRDERLNLETLEKINGKIVELNELNKTHGMSFELFQNGSEIAEAFSGKGGYSGVMIEAPHYIGLKTGESMESELYGAYYMEDLITLIHGLDVGTCWIGLQNVSDDEKVKVLGEDGGKINYLLAIGKATRSNPFLEEETADRKPLSELVFDERIGNPADPDMLETRGLLDLFYYVRFAQSERNAQPWIFLIEGPKISMLMKKDEVKPADAGIMMYYFKSMLEVLGINTRWELVEDKIIDDYKVIAEIRV